MNHRIDKIIGIGPVYRRKLETAGIGTTAALLERCGEPMGRNAVSAMTGIRETQLLKWVRMADLMRLEGVGNDVSQLLEAAGVDTVRALRQHAPDALHGRLVHVNEGRKFARRTPDLLEVTRWVAAARSIEARVSH